MNSAMMVPPGSLKPTPDPGALTQDDYNNMNVVVEGKLDKVNKNTGSDNTEPPAVQKMAHVKNLNTMKTHTFVQDSEKNSVSGHWSPEQYSKSNSSVSSSCEMRDVVPKLVPAKRTNQDVSEEVTRKNSTGQWYHSRKSRSNNNNCDDEDFLLSDSKAAYMNSCNYGSGGSTWKKQRWSKGDFENFSRLHFPWKRIAYIGVLLALGVICAILAVMKLCGIAHWMNTATFAVIIMGTVMLLPPGLYYGRIIICISCQCKGYTLWDLPAGPFG